MRKANTKPKAPTQQEQPNPEFLSDEPDTPWVPFVDSTEYKELHANDPEKKKPALSRLQRLCAGTVFGAALIVCLFAIISTSETKQNVTTQRQPELTEEEKQEQRAAEEKLEIRALLTRLNNTVQHYLEAETIAQKATCVRDTKRVLPLMRDHYARHPLQPKKFKRITSKRAIAIWSQPFILVMAELEDGTKEFLTIAQSKNNSFSIDWETHVYYQPVDWKTYTDPTQRPSLADMRVYVKPDKHYTGSFSNSKYECFRLVSRDNKKPIYGYAKIGSPVWHDLRIFFTGRKKGHYHGEPLLLRLRKHQAADQSNTVVIEKFLSDRWLTPPGMPSKPSTQLSMVPTNSK